MLLTNGSGSLYNKWYGHLYKISFDIIVADAPKIRPTTSPIILLEQTALTSHKDIA
jgi:hypothetical protein